MSSLAQLVEVLDDQARLSAIRATAIAIGLDAEARTRLRALVRVEQGPPFLVRQGRVDAWLEVAAGGAVTLRRDAPGGLPVLDMTKAVEEDPELPNWLSRVADRTGAGAKAAKLIGPVFDFRALPSRIEIEQLRKWAALIESPAYRTATRISSVIDTLRPGSVKGPGAAKNGRVPLSVAYWTAIHIMGNLMFLASDREARPFLADMAATIRWQVWTPSFPLLRERTMWLAVCAARAASAFGPSVIGTISTAWPQRPIP